MTQNSSGCRYSNKRSGYWNARCREDESSLNLLREKCRRLDVAASGTRTGFLTLVLAALNSRDLRVRTAAVDLDLAANNSFRKSPASVAEIMQQLKGDPEGRGLALWRLGSLGNRGGVEPEKVLHSLLNYAHDPNEHTRYWAVEGLAMLGNDATIGPLLERAYARHITSSPANVPLRVAWANPVY